MLRIGGNKKISAEWGDSVVAVVWQECLGGLVEELSSQDYNTWIRPLQARVDESRLTILAPNRYVREKVQEKYLKRIRELVEWHGDPASPLSVELEVGGKERQAGSPLRVEGDRHEEALNKTFTFDTFVKGASNELAVATADHVAKNPGRIVQPTASLWRGWAGQDAPYARGWQ